MTIVIAYTTTQTTTRFSGQHLSSDDWRIREKIVTSVLCCIITTVTTLPGKSWKVMEFSKTIFQAWKVMENSEGHGKSWKITMMSCNFCID